MLKPLVKIFLIVVIVWGITFFMVMKAYKTNKLLLEGYDSYENTLKQFEKRTRTLKNLSDLNGMY